jgi:two-component system, NtrC family, sensor histidine kinase GlrK
MSLWQPRSLQQLVLVSIFAALAPLGLAILFTVETLGELSEKNRQVTQTVVDATRLDQQIQRDVLELERRARQFMALSDTELASLFEREREILSHSLQTLQETMPTQSPDISGLLGSLERLTLPEPGSADSLDTTMSVESQMERLNHEFSVINEQSNAIQTWLLSSVDQMLESNAEEAASLRDNLTLQLSILAAATVALLLFLAYWINKPVKDLSQEIHLLGTSGLSHPIEISGPLELQALGSELEWLRQSLHESEQQKEQFLRHISHELKTPLASLREGADLLADQVPGHLSRQQSEIVEIVRQNGIELQRLIENLLDYNRLPAQQLNIEDFELESLWQDIMASYSLSLNKKSLQLSHSGSITSWRADREKLRTCLDNLFSNAVNYTPDGGRIDITWRSENATLIVEVANSGEPIPPEDVERVFEPFFQSAAKRIGPIKGSGIGLSVARECIEAQGGTLAVAKHDKLPVCFQLICPAH